MADEHTSVMPYIMEKDDNEFQMMERSEKLHPHPLIFHDGQDDSSDDQPRVCNVCVRLISPADPFRRCSECPDFFLHKCCANLPTQSQHPKLKHTLFLVPKAPHSSISGCFFCDICHKQSNGFAYMSKNVNYAIDVVCAMMPPSIIHQLHAKSHILYLSRDHDTPYTIFCSCCRSYLSGPYYACTSCRDFGLHLECARLPSSIKHKFDDHILTLTAGDHLPKVVQKICEICEDYIILEHWCYSCSQCDQWFHPNCIRGFSNLKLGATIKVNCHDCPLALIRESSVYGYRCDSCLQVFRPTKTLSNWLCHLNQQSAYECSNCYFRIHESCAEKCLLR